MTSGGHKEEISRLIDDHVSRIKNDSLDILMIEQKYKTGDGLAVIKMSMEKDPVIKYASKNIKSILGYTAEEGVGKRLSSILANPKSTLEEASLLAKLKTRPQTVKLERIVHKNGSIVTVVGLLFVKNGEIVECIMNITDLLK